MSIGFIRRSHEWRSGPNGASTTVLTDIDLIEFSYLGSTAMAANPLAMVSGVKAITELDGWDELDQFIELADVHRRAAEAQAHAERRELDDLEFAAGCARCPAHTRGDRSGHAAAAPR